MNSYSKSDDLFGRAAKLIPGGVNSPVRAFKSVGRNPLFIDRGEGSRIYDVDGNSYLDYVMSYGPLLFGHAPAEVIEAVGRAATKGTSFGASTPGELEFAELLTSMIPSIEKVRLVNSGTEAVMSAVRTARGFTGRDKILKFDGCYHGHSDGLLPTAGSGVATYDLPGSAGIPQNLTRDTITVPFNDLDKVRMALDAHPNQFAAIVLEPVPVNMGVVLPKPGFLAALREETAKRGILLIFDEVITGFRLSAGGAQGVYGIAPDLTCLGKIVGGGLPLAAFGGRREVMDMLAPVGPVYQAGTLSGNPVAVAAGIAVMKRIKSSSSLYSDLDMKMSWLAAVTEESASIRKVAHRINRIGSVMTFFFTGSDVVDYASAKQSNTAAYAEYFKNLLNAGVYLAPSQFEASFASTVHSSDDLELTANAVDKALSSLSF
jgi:glutamate-1-semialdehyde 2,1-aminomutase